MSQGVQAPRPAQVGRTGGVLSWLVVGSGFCLLFSVVKIGTWVNHWYIAEQFYAEPETPGGNSDVIMLLRTGNQQLLNGVFWLGMALLCALGAVLVRRRRSRP